MKKYLGYLAIMLGSAIFFFVLYLNSRYSQTLRPFSPSTILSPSWDKYKQQFVNADGRVIDHSQNGLTTSEGQSYAMLRAVWVDDKPGFDLAWKWTRENLQHEEDKLFGWRWGQRPDGSFGFLENGGENSASDADTDIALALILAHRRWRQSEYLDQAKEIINDIWEKDTASITGGKRYVVAGNWAQNPDRIILNPSYFAPYAWRLFAIVDNQHDWNSLIDPAYEILAKTSASPTGLPPDWIAINRHNGDIITPEVSTLTQNYSFDAMRVPWRVNLDWQWNRDPRAESYLTNHFQKLLTDYQMTGKLAGSYGHDGRVLVSGESPAMYATAIGYFMVKDPGLAKKMYEEKILRLYSNDTNSFQSTLPYYDQNWLWLGAGLYNNYLIAF